MATRMKVLGISGVVVNGRVRDLRELHETGLPVRQYSFLMVLYGWGFSRSER